jgi:hypothetical protein
MDFIRVTWLQSEFQANLQESFSEFHVASRPKVISLNSIKPLGCYRVFRIGNSNLEFYDIYGKMKKYELFKIFQRPRKKYRKFRKNPVF